MKIIEEIEQLVESSKISEFDGDLYNKVAGIASAFTDNGNKDIPDQKLKDMIVKKLKTDKFNFTALELKKCFDKFFQSNEVRYIDPDNVKNYDPNDIEKVKDAQGNDRYKRKDGDSSTADKATDTIDKKSYNYNITNNDLKKGKTYACEEPLNFGELEDLSDYEGYQEKIKAAGLVNDEGIIEIPAGTEFKLLGTKYGDYEIEVNGVTLDAVFDDDEMKFADTSK